ncbi:uncharacterized protein K02A2.6-like [Armigeres subalbatus]|uniref:uncharacterized protein K02A2.6-like n=1 Tax=Armigeres subalbatus TaxID=124917 RepID=UPI002ED63573
MDSNQFKMFLDHQVNMFNQLMQSVNATATSVATATTASLQAQLRQVEQRSCASSVPVPQPSPLALDGDMEENFDFFVKSWKDYVKATGMEDWPPADNAKKVSFLLAIIGEPARKKYRNFELTPAEAADTQSALRAIKAKVVAKRNIIIDRLDFFSAVQAPRENVDDFCSRLKGLAKVARLGNLESELMAYKLVTANRWQHLRTKMLTISDITLDKAVDLCRAEEITEKRSHELTYVTPEAEVNKIAKGKARSKQVNSPRCKFCGDAHEFSKGTCPALGKRCYKCNGKNHFEKVCRAAAKQKNRRSRSIREVKEECSSEDEASENGESSEESEQEYHISRIFDNSVDGGGVVAELDIKFARSWKSVLCDLDTGANVSLIGLDHLKKLTEDRNPSLQPSTLRLQSFGGNPIKVLGEVKVKCRRLNRKYKLILQVVDVEHRPLLSARASRELGFVKFCEAVKFNASEPKPSIDKLMRVYRVQAQQIIDEYKDLFEGYGKFPGKVTLELDENIKPTIQSPRRVPIALRQDLKKELESLEQSGIIVKESNHTNWVSNLVLVQRPKAGLRICLDPVMLNKALRRPNLQSTTLDEILPELGKARVFTTIDTKKGFWHVVLDEESSKLTTFWTPFGRYRWTRLPFGIASAPEIFQLKLQQVIQDLEGVECIADDLLIFGIGDTLEAALKNHNHNLQLLFRRLKENNVKLNRSKLNVCQTSVKFYGHVLTTQGLRPDETKRLAIKNYPTPSDRKEVHRFIGMVNYLSKFIRNLSINLTNLRKLILETVPWQWTPVEQEEFELVKSLVSNINTLQYYDVTKPLTVECDASCFGLGVAVYQNGGIIGYASRTLTATEKNYAQIEKELLAIVFACTRFDQLIVGNPRTVIKTDHKPLLNVFNKPLLSAPKRLQHMLLKLQRYNLHLEFVTGKNNVVADALSRAPLQNEDCDSYEKMNVYEVLQEMSQVKLSSFLNVSDARLAELAEYTNGDSSLQAITHYIQHGWPSTVDQVPDGAKIYFAYRHELATQDGLIFRGDRILVPHALRRKLVDSCHASHNGIEATLKLARSNLFWPGMSSQVKDVVKQCSVCAKFAPCQANPPMRSHKIPVYPFQMVSLDVFFAEYRGSKRKFLVTVDHYSDFFDDATPSKFASPVLPPSSVTSNGVKNNHQNDVQPVQQSSSSSNDSSVTFEEVPNENAPTTMSSTESAGVVSPSTRSTPDTSCERPRRQTRLPSRFRDYQL